MKKSKIAILLAVMVASSGLLVACASSTSTDTSAGATQAVGTFSDLQKTLNSTGNWLGAIKSDVDASGKTLTVSGNFVGDGQVARKLALYNQTSDFKVTASYTLTLAKLVDNSPGFYVSNGTVKGDVYVNASGFHGQNGVDQNGATVTSKIDGNLIFASQALLDTYNALPDAQKVAVTGETKVETGKVTTLTAGLITVGKQGAITYNKTADVSTGATAGTSDLSTLIKGLGKNGAWISAIKGDLDASDKTLTVDGTYIGTKGTVARKLALYTQDANRVTTATYTLSVGKLEVNSPQFYVSNGTVKGDVYVASAATNFHGEAGKDAAGNAVVPSVDGNLYFATQKQLDTYTALPDAQKLHVTGTVAVKTVN